MSELARGLRVLVLAAIVLCIVASLTGASGKDTGTTGLRIASVDLQRLQNEYLPLKSFKQELDAKQEDLNIQVQTWQQNPLLNADDQKTLADFAIKEKAANGHGLSAAEQTTRQGLLNASNKLNDDYARLQGTGMGAATDADKQQLNTYIKLASDTEARAQALKQQLETDLKKELTDVLDQAQKRMKEAFGKIAKEKGCSLILSTEIAPYTEYDCTDDVLKLMNKK